MAERQLAAARYTALKAVTAALVERGFGGQKMAAAVTRVGQPAISDYCSRGAADSYMPIDVLLDLMAASGEMAVLRHLAEDMHCLLVPLPTGVDGSVLAESTGRSAREFGDVMMRLGSSLRDGTIDAGEKADILTEILEAMLALASLAEAVKAAAGGAS